ncbi:MAG: hypothetical protein HY975_01645 [Candidatus Kerfeldbacteria bacterium]|nr:hypothetical protein [Candidatus Kerfeldbacteria bacterium]
MPPIKPTASIREKWQRVTPTRVTDYTDGVSNPTTDYQAATVAAEPAYEAGIQQAISQKRFGKGVRESGTAKWQSRSIAVGSPRWPQGVQAAGPDFEKGFAAFRDTIERVQLPPRGPAGDPRNIERVATIARALRATKVKP